MPKAAIKHRLQALYTQLLHAHGRQGWWPIPGNAGRRGFDFLGYHVGDFSQPATPAGRFEVVMGAVLTQNTTWRNAAAALASLRNAGIRLPGDILAVPPGPLARLVRSSGYFNQKGKKLYAVAALFSLPGALTIGGAPARETLLRQWGIGPETADSILLYAFGSPVFVVDAYTRRILLRIGMIQGRETYAGIQAMFHDSIRRHAALYNEYHALFVQHAKQFCKTRPECAFCPVRPCRTRKNSSILNRRTFSATLVPDGPAQGG
jgi:endonuclease-3 related protein